ARPVDGDLTRVDLLRGQRGRRHAVSEAIARAVGAAQGERLLVRHRAFRHRPGPDARAAADADAVPQDRRLAHAGPRDELGAAREGARLHQGGREAQDRDDCRARRGREYDGRAVPARRGLHARALPAGGGGRPAGAVAGDSALGSSRSRRRDAYTARVSRTSAEASDVASAARPSVEAFEVASAAQPSATRPTSRSSWRYPPRGIIRPSGRWKRNSPHSSRHILNPPSCTSTWW